MEKIRELFLTDEEIELLDDLVEKEFIESKDSDKFKAFSSIMSKLSNAYLKKRFIGECGQSGEKILLDEKGIPEMRTFRCEKPGCECDWRSYYVETWCPRCNG